MTQLHVNIDHIATLRNVRKALEPSPLEAVKLLEGTKIAGITTHLREDRRHITNKDIEEIDAYLRDSRLTLTFEMGATKEIREIALKTQARLATLVPERREELTTEGGLNVVAQKDYLREFIKPLYDNGTKVSLFIDPIAEQIEASKKIGAQFIEIHTGNFANLFTKYHSQQAALGGFFSGLEEDLLTYEQVTTPVKEEIDRIKQAVNLASSLGLQVNLGHGLTIPNLPCLLSQLTRGFSTSLIQELHIGHSIISNALYYGLNKTIESFIWAMTSRARERVLA